MTALPLSTATRRLLAAIGLTACHLSASHAATDYNGNGYDDVWEQCFGVTSLSAYPPGYDKDGDGATNLMESIAGTSPGNPQDVLQIQSIVYSGGNLLISLKTQAGKRYSLEGSSAPNGPWVAEGSPISGTGTLQTFTLADTAGSAPRFYRVTASDVDTDGDGVSDWAEALMGTSPTLASSPANAAGGSAPDGEVLRSLMSFTATVVTTSAYEKEGTPALIRLNRSYGTMPLTLKISAAGNADATLGSATTSDYLLKDAANNTVLPTGFVIPGAVSQFDIKVTPTADTLNEVPEVLRLTFRATSGSITTPVATTQAVDIRDATNTDANRRLFVAYLGREAGASTTATGMATLLLNGDNTEAVVNTSFSNLTSLQISSHLHASPPNDPLASGPIIESLELGQVSGHGYHIGPEPVGGWNNAQATLDALFSGHLYVNVHSASYASGEIRGNFAPTGGSVAEPPAPPPAPVYGSEGWPVLAGADLDRDIARFLMQATYGPTAESIQEVKDLITANGGNALAGYSAWIDRQMDLSQTPSPNLMRLVQAADAEDFFIRGNTPLNWLNDPQFGADTQRWDGSNWVSSPLTANSPQFFNRAREWWTLVLQCKDQLRQRMALALSEILVVSEYERTIRDHHYGMANYWDMLAADAFSSYRKVLGDVTRSPMMAYYLSYLRNSKASGNILPDENYAREVMQLFSVGLSNRHLDGTLRLGSDGLPLPTYDQNDIREMARVFTGFGIGKFHTKVMAPTHPTPSLMEVGELVENTTYTRKAYGWTPYWAGPFTSPLKLFDAYHDFGAKVLFNGKIGQVNLPDRANSASESEGLADVEEALNALAGQDTGSGSYTGHPNTPVFISRLLIQRFTTSNPSAGYLYRVANTFKGSNGNLGAVVRAILLDPEARNLTLADNSAAPGKIKEPLLHFTNLIRALNLRTGLPLVNLTTVPLNFTSLQSPVTEPYPLSEYSKFPAGSVRFRFYDTTQLLGQSPQRAPSVFNWFLPDYLSPGPLARAGMFAPELQAATESSVVNLANFIQMVSFTGVDLDNFPNLAGYRSPSGAQFTIPQWAVDKGYFSATQFTPGTNQPASLYREPDRLVSNYDGLVTLYTNTYSSALASQYAPAAVPAVPGTNEKAAAHAEAVRALVDHLDAMLAAGSLKAAYGSMTSDNPRKAIFDGLNSIAANNRHTTEPTNFAADALIRARNAVYAVATSPQAITLK